MPTIVNPAPITPNTFDGFWVSNLHVVFPQNETVKGVVLARLLPYDGENLLATGSKDVRILGLDQAKRNSNPNLNLLLTTLETELARLSPDSGALRSVSVVAPDPNKPVTATGVFVDLTKRPHTIKDCFGAAAEDATFAAALNNVLGSVAALAGLTVSFDS